MVQRSERNGFKTYLLFQPRLINNREVGKVKKVNKVEGNNRRALGDIGNLVTVRGAIDVKDLQKINRPVTRSFCAQLLANAQAAAENKKVAVVVNGGPVVKKGVAIEGKAVEKKMVVVNRSISYDVPFST